MDDSLRDRLARINDFSDEAIGVRLAATIDALGLSLAAFSRRIGQPENRLRNAVKGRNAPNTATLHALYRQNNIDASFLLFGDYRQLTVEMQERIFASLLKFRERVEGWSEDA